MGARKRSTVQTTFAIMEELVEVDAAGVTELANAVGVSKGAVHTHLATLVDAGWVIKSGTDYRMSLHLFNLGQRLRGRIDLYLFGKDEVEALSQETNLHTQIMVEEDGMGICVFTCAADDAAKDYHLRKLEVSRPLHSSATGKSILAFKDEAEIQEIIRTHGLPASTNRTITDEDVLLEELTTIRERGYALSDREGFERTRAVGAPVRDPDDNVLGAISASGPAQRLHEEYVHDELQQRVKQAVNQIEIAIELKVDRAAGQM